MAVVRRSYSDRRGHFSSTEPPQRISPLVILQARFQQKQLQEKEEKLVRLYEEQQERALRSVGSRSHSGGSSVASVGAGKVRHMFQTRREHSEPRLGRDKSHPLQPLHATRTSARRRHEPPTADRNQRTFSLDRNDNHNYNNNNREIEFDCNHNYNFQRERKLQRAVNTRWHPRSDTDYSFQLVDDYYNSRYRNELEDFDRTESYKLSVGDGSRMEGRYKSYVSQTAFTKKPHLGTGRPAKAPPEPKEGGSGHLNGSASSPVRKIRKPTPVPLSVAPPQHLLQKEAKKTTRIETIREIPSSVSTPKAPSSRTVAGSLQKPTTPKRTLPPSRTSPSKPLPTTATRTSAPPSDLVNCRTCGRHFAADRVSKHEEVCQKSSRNKRKPFDALQQRVKGTEVEQFIRKSTKPSRAQPEKVAKPQSNWRKKHEEFINNIRAAKEVSAHLKKGGKLSDLPPPPPSDYSDYVPCPHCGRKFNSSAAERHIPKCANIINNKPKANSLQKSSKLLRPASTAARGRK